MSLSGKTVLLGVTGGIAAYKAVEVASRLVKLGARLHVLMTPAATQMVAPLTFQAISGQPVFTELLGPQTLGHVDHVELSHRADLYIVAPATADAIAHLAYGFADNVVNTVALGVTCPRLLCPAMETNMWQHPLTQRNVATLGAIGWQVLPPEGGRLASGRTGAGRLPEPATIVEVAQGLFRPKDLTGRKVLVNAGATQENFDPVRFFTNRSTGKMGYAIARAARDRGAEVVLVTGPTFLTPPSGVEVVPIETCLQLQAACEAHFDAADVTIGAAAPADYRPATYSDEKIKKQGDEALVLELVQNPDVIAGLGQRKRPGQVLIGFAAETQNLISHAQGKIRKKNLDMIVANDVKAPGSGFGTDTNQVVLIGRDLEPVYLPLLPKEEVAHAILDWAVARLPENPA